MGRWEKGILQGVSILCLAYIFFWIGEVTWHLTGATFSIFLVVLGLLFYLQTLNRKHGWVTAAWILAVLWSALVFVTFVLSAYHAHPDYSGIPAWMQVASPYVYASTPLLLIWCLRFVIPTLWDVNGSR